VVSLVVVVVSCLPEVLSKEIWHISVYLMLVSGCVKSFPQVLYNVLLVAQWVQFFMS